MIYVRDNLDYGEVGVGCYLFPLPRNMKSPTSADITAPHIFYCLSDARTERLIQDGNVYSLTNSPTRVNETNATTKRWNR